jgi:hypothetical protein
MKAMLNGTIPEVPTQDPLPVRSFFIARDPGIFVLILSYLEYDFLENCTHKVTLQKLLVDAKFFKLTKLEEIVTKKIRIRTHKRKALEATEEYSEEEEEEEEMETDDDGIEEIPSTSNSVTLNSLTVNLVKPTKNAKEKAVKGNSMFQFGKLSEKQNPAKEQIRDESEEEDEEDEVEAEKAKSSTKKPPTVPKKTGDTDERKKKAKSTTSENKL